MGNSRCYTYDTTSLRVHRSHKNLVLGAADGFAGGYLRAYHEVEQKEFSCFLGWASCTICCPVSRLHAVLAGESFLGPVCEAYRSCLFLATSWRTLKWTIGFAIYATCTSLPDVQQYICGGMFMCLRAYFLPPNAAIESDQRYEIITEGPGYCSLV